MSQANAATSSNIVTLTAPVPVTVDEMLSRRTLKTGMTLNDHVETIHIKLWEKPEYRRLLDAVYDSEAVEGATLCDDHEAARMIRTYGAANNSPAVASCRLATVMKSLRVVMRRYHLGRHERAQTIGGEQIGN